MPGVTEKQIIAARQMTAIEFLQRYRPEELVKAGSRGEFQLGHMTASKSMEKPLISIGKAGILAVSPLSTISSRWKKWGS